MAVLNRLQVEAEYEGQRIDNFLLRHFKGVPKTRIYRMLRTGEVRLDGARTRPEQRLVAGQWLRLPPVRVPEAQQIDSQERFGSATALVERVEQIYEANGLLAVNKPVGLAVHGGSGISLGLVEAFRASGQWGSSLDLVHRLDRETSGLLFLATKRSSLLNLHRQIQAGRFRKHYLALVKGAWKRAGLSSLCDPLVKVLHPGGERFVRLACEGEAGQAAMTQVKALSTWEHRQLGPLSLLECQPVTGRTHQIRVHLASSGFPIVGDPKYGDQVFNNQLQASIKVSRMFLHAWKASFDSELSRERVLAQPGSDWQKGQSRLGCPWTPRPAADISDPPSTSTTL